MVTSSSTLRPSHFLRPLHVLRTYLAIVGRILADRFTFHTTVEPRPLPVSPLHRVSKVHVGKSRQRPNQGIVAHFSFPSTRFSFDYSASIIDIYPLLEIDFGDRIDDRIESFLTLSSNLSSSSTDLESLPPIIGCKRRNPRILFCVYKFSFASRGRRKKLFGFDGYIYINVMKEEIIEGR